MHIKNTLTLSYRVVIIQLFSD